MVFFVVFIILYFGKEVKREIEIFLNFGGVTMIKIFIQVDLVKYYKISTIKRKNTENAVSYNTDRTICSLRYMKGILSVENYFF